MVFSLTLFVSYLAGYTNDRVTLFALILSSGLVVDDRSSTSRTSTGTCGAAASLRSTPCARR